VEEVAKPRRKIGVIGLCALIIIMGVLLFLLFSAFGVLRFWQAEKGPQGETDLAFSEVSLPFSNEIDLENSLPFLASAALDINGDGRDELFLGGGDTQADKIFSYTDQGFKVLPISFEKESIDATHGAAAIDIDNDGDTDLFAARESGVWFHENLGGSFGSVKLDFGIADNTTPLSLGFGDVNKDGLADMYVAGYIKIGLLKARLSSQVIMVGIVISY